MRRIHISLTLKSHFFFLIIITVFLELLPRGEAEKKKKTEKQIENRSGEKINTHISGAKAPLFFFSLLSCGEGKSSS